MLEELQELGLSRRESTCYLSLLELGSTRVGPIVKHSQIPSSKIYEVLERLSSKGLVTTVIKKNIKHFQAANPRILITMLNERKKKIEQIIPELMLKQSSKQEGVRFYEGQKALFTLFTDLVENEPKGEYMVFSINEENKNDAAKLFFKNLAVRRKEKGLRVLVLQNKKYHKEEKHTKVKIRYTQFNLPQGITIFNDNIILLSWVETPVAIHIQSPVMASQLKEFFTDLWKQAK